ncbi:MAG: sensor histidine kinase [Clostridia bacterium]|nr:sensor histidine kinase [Clostridia bacterium]
MSFYKKLNLKNKLLFIFMMQMFLPIIILGVFLLRNVESNMKNQALTLSYDMLKVLEMRIEDFTEGIKNVSQDLLYDDEIYDVLNDDQSDKFIYYNHVNALKNTLRKTTLSKDGIQAISIVDLLGTHYAYDLNSGRTNISNTLPYKELLLLAREAKGRPVWYVDDEKDGAVYVTRIVNDIETFNEIGLMVILVDLSSMKSDYETLNSQLIENTYLVTDGGYVIFSNKTDEGDETISLPSFEDDVFYDDSHKKEMITYRKMQSMEWTLITVISKENLLQNVTQFMKWSLIIFVPLALLLSLFTIFEGMHIVDSIKKIVAGMYLVRKDQRYEKVTVDREDELGFLAQAYNDMAAEIEHLVQDVYSEQIMRKETEIKALQAQINPHFLYNTLETINWHAQLKGAPEISDMVTALSSIMEANIGRDNKLITMREEIEYIEHYISIMKYRFDGRITFKKDIDPKIMGLKIPRLILQPIVENAINHGIGKTTYEGKIDITGIIDQEEVRIEICDNGKGMDEAILHDLNQRIDHRNNLEGSIGLTNVHKRIKLFYGEPYGIRIESKEDIYTKVVVTLPLKYMNEEGFYV